jgi:hypothetical protein
MGHDHTDHHHAHEQYAARKHPEFVVLDIGGDVGALVIHADAEMHGTEVEISPAADDASRSHKEVLERKTGDGAAFTAVFDGLAAGDYSLWVHGDLRARGVSIEGGTIAELDWRTAAVVP